MTARTPSPTPGGLHALLYVSRLAPMAPLLSVADIARGARVRNALEGITGVLLFDGESFAQFVEGPATAIEHLGSRLAHDSRHVDLVVLSMGPSGADRRFGRWELGYVEVEGDGVLDDLRPLRGERAVVAFAAMIPAHDERAGRALPVAA